MDLGWKGIVGRTRWKGSRCRRGDSKHIAMAKFGLKLKLTLEGKRENEPRD
jgi:hypothetical protein